MITLVYTIDFSDVSADEEDYIDNLTIIQNFIASSLKRYIDTSTIPDFLPAYNHEKDAIFRYRITLLFSNSAAFLAALNLLRSFCELNYFLYDEDPIIKT